MGPYRKLWFTLIAVLAVTFSLLGFYGGEVYRQAPPIPQRPWSRPTGNACSAATTSWTGRPPGSRWAACSRLALPRRLPGAGLDGRLAAPRAGRLDLAAREAHGQPYAELPAPAQAALRETLKAEYRGNRVNADEVLTVMARRAPPPRPPALL